MHDFRQTVMGRLRFNRDALDPRLGFRPMSRLAIPYQVQGHFNWGPDLGEHEVYPAQQLIRGGSGCRQDPAQGRILLECEPSDFRSTAEDETSNYYSAYLWIIFVLQNESGDAFFSAPNDQWKNILCFFEHGNIADATTFQALKENLAIKACSSIADIFAREAAMQRKLKISYGCALDDSNCEHGTLLYPVEPIEFHASAAPPVRRRTARIVDIFRALAEEQSSRGGSLARFPAANQALAEKRLLLPPNQSPATGNAYSSCRLPELVDGFYRQLDS